jgi:glycine cleavage system aminomethyltransferase T
VAELWSVYANEEACDIAMRAPGAGRVAPDEVMVRGPIAEDLRSAIHTVDHDALIRETTEGWVEIAVHGGDARDVFAVLSELPLPDGPGFVQGDVARIAARVFVQEDGIRLLVPAYWESHLRRRLDDVGSAT